MITVVAGPPLAGKTTWVRERALAGHPVVDFDAIALALGSDHSHDHPPMVRRLAFDARRAAIDTILAQPSQTAWIIDTAPTPNMLRRYASARARLEVIDPGMDVVLGRLDGAGRPAWTEGEIRNWYRKHPPKGRP